MLLRIRWSRRNPSTCRDDTTAKYQISSDSIDTAEKPFTYYTIILLFCPRTEICDSKVVHQTFRSSLLGISVATDFLLSDIFLKNFIWGMVNHVSVLRYCITTLKTSLIPSCTQHTSYLTKKIDFVQAGSRDHICWSLGGDHLAINLEYFINEIIKVSD